MASSIGATSGCAINRFSSLMHRGSEGSPMRKISVIYSAPNSPVCSCHRAIALTESRGNSRMIFRTSIDAGVVALKASWGTSNARSLEHATSIVAAKNPESAVRNGCEMPFLEQGDVSIGMVFDGIGEVSRSSFESMQR